MAFLTCYPAGFGPSTKLGRVLWDIHAPVPSYAKIGGSMERFFGKMEVGRNVNCVTTQPERYIPSGRHVLDGQMCEQDESVDVDKAWYRVEVADAVPATKDQGASFQRQDAAAPYP